MTAFAAQWNQRQEKSMCAGNTGRRTTCVDPRAIQTMNRESRTLFGEDHLYEPNFVAPIQLPEEHQELLGVEYLYSQSSSFSSSSKYYEMEGKKGHIYVGLF